MSHFTVLVVGEKVEEQLARYHEFECTGDDNEYIQEIDETEKARANYEKDTTTRYKDPQGNLHNPYTAEGDFAFLEFWRDPTPEEEAKHGKMYGSGGGSNIRWFSHDWKDGRGYRAKVFELPQGWEEVEVPTQEVESFAEFVEGYHGHKAVKPGETIDYAEKHKYGYTLLDAEDNVVKVVDRTNPAAKWDWYQIGGRWNGFFKMKPQTVGVLGESSAIATMDAEYEAPTPDRADICMKGDVDIVGMREEAGHRAGITYDTYQEIVAGTPEPISWQAMQEKHKTSELDKDGEPKTDWEAARTEYHAQARIKALHTSKNRDAIWWNVEDFACTREEYVNRARAAAIATFAVVKDGKWYERGEMGWWGVVSDEKNRDEWHAQFSNLIDSLPDKTMLTVVDCHI